MKHIASILTAGILLAAGSVRGAVLGVSPTNFAREMTEGQTLVGDVLKVANTGGTGDTMTYTVTATSSPTMWLSVSPTNGSVLDKNTNSVAVMYATTNMSVGWYTGEVDVVAMGVGTQAVSVVLRVDYQPEVAWDAGSKVWTNELMAGGSLADTTVAVWNASGTPAAQMNYTVSVLNDPFGWVSVVSNAIGSSTGDYQYVTVRYTTAELPAGDYAAQLKVEGMDPATGMATTNGPLYTWLQLTIKGTPGLRTDVTSLSQTLLENHTATNIISIWNDGREPRGGMRYTVTPDVNWVTVNPSTGVVTDNVDSVQVTWGTTLPPGVYQGNLVVTAEDAQHPEISAGGSPLTIPLALTVTPRTPLNMELPTVAGKMYIGQTVQVNVGLWQNQARLIFAYQWERASNKSGGGREVLSGAVGTNYVITAADHGKYLRVGVTATDPEPFPISSTVYSAWVDSAKVKALKSDFNGDGITDLWLYDEVSGNWHMSFGTTESGEGIFPGGPGMVAVPGDYDGDGNEDVGTYDAAHGIWHILFLPRAVYVYGSLFGGTAEEAEAMPVPADYDGDGATDVALYLRGYWAVFYSSRGAVSVVEPFADIWGEPVSGDWDGDGMTDMGVYDSGTWTLRMGDGSVGVQEFGGGGAGILPAQADYDGDGATDLGVYDVGANQWRWRESSSGFEQSVSFGTYNSGMVAVPGYYDHDNLSDWAQVFPYNDDFTVWEVKRTAEPTDFPYPYHGQSYQRSIDCWRVSW